MRDERFALSPKACKRGKFGLYIIYKVYFDDKHIKLTNIFINYPKKISTMKKLMMGAACLALLLGSCVKNEESQSVTNIRDAKTEQLKSVAALNNATAEAAKTLAEADAALMLAEAEAKKAEAALIAAQAKAAEIEAQLKEVELEAARAELEALKAQYEAEIAKWEAKKAEYLAKMEQAAVKAQEALIKAEEALAKAEESYINTLEGIESREAAKMVTLYNAYAQASRNLISAQNTLAACKVELAKAETALVNAEESKKSYVEYQEELIETALENIAKAEARIEIYKEYATEVDLEAIQADIDEAYIAWQTALKEYNINYNEPSAELYTKKDRIYSAIYQGRVVDENGQYVGNSYAALYSADGSMYTTLTARNLLGYSDIRQSLGFGADVTYRYMDIDEDGSDEMVYGYSVQSEDELTGNTSSEFIPLFADNRDYETIIKDYKRQGTEGYSQYSVELIKSYAFFDKEAIAEYIEILKAKSDDAVADGTEAVQKDYDNAVENEAKYKAVTEAAKAWKEAQEAYNNANASATNDHFTFLNEETGEREPGAANAVRQAKNAVANAKTAVNAAEAKDKEYTTKDTGKVAVATAAVEEYTKKDTGKVAVAEKALKDAKDAQAALKATATDAEKKAAADAVAAAEKALADVKKQLAAAEEALADVKKQAAWAAEDLKKAEAALEAAEAELEAAEAALEAAKAEVIVAENANDDAKRAYQVACAEADVYAYDNANQAFNAASSAYTYWVGEVKKYADQLADIEENGGVSDAKRIAWIEKNVASISEYMAWADAQIAEYNKLQLEWLDLEVARLQEDRKVTLLKNEYNALNSVLADAESALNEIPGIEEQIEGYEKQIAQYEKSIEEATAFTEEKQIIEKWQLEVAMAEELVNVRQVELAAAKAAYEAAVATPEE